MRRRCSSSAGCCRSRDRAACASRSARVAITLTKASRHCHSRRGGGCAANGSSSSSRRGRDSASTGPTPCRCARPGARRHPGTLTSTCHSTGARRRDPASSPACSGCRAARGTCGAAGPGLARRPTSPGPSAAAAYCCAARRVAGSRYGAAPGGEPGARSGSATGRAVPRGSACRAASSPCVLCSLSVACCVGLSTACQI